MKLTEDQIRIAANAAMIANGNWRAIARAVADSLPEPEPMLPVIPEITDSDVDAVLSRVRKSEFGYAWRDLLEAYRERLLAALPHWVPIAPGTVIAAGTRYRTEYTSGYICENTADTDIGVNSTTGYRWYIDPRTVPTPAKPADPRIAVVREYYEGAGIAPSDDGIRYLLACLDGAEGQA